MSTAASQDRCSYIDCRYVLVKFRNSHKLVCQKCGRFYGYVKSGKDMEVIEAEIRRLGYFDPNQLARDKQKVNYD